MRFRARAARREIGVPENAWVPIEALSPYVVCAIVGAEDPEFFQHRGFWWAQVVRAVRLAHATGKPVRGVSTITQQLARNLYLHPERSASRKLREALLTRRLERTLTKAGILELYVNVVEWGEGVWGIGSAARHYFGCLPAALDPFESVFLASLLPAPRAPLAGRNLWRAADSQRRLVAFLYGCGVLSRTEELPVLARISALARVMAAGAPLADGLRHVRAITLAPRPDGGRRGSIRDLIADACGYDRRVAFGHLLAAARVEPSVLEERPTWWNVRPSP